MKFKSPQDVIDVANDRGFEVLVDPGPPPMPFLRFASARKTDATPALIEALKAWRLEIIELLSHGDAWES